MKFSQVVLLVIVINLLNVVFTLALTSNNINDLEDEFIAWFAEDSGDDSESFMERVDGTNGFSKGVKVSDNWILKKIGDIAQGFTSAVNLVTIGFELVLLILWGWIAPVEYILFQAESITFLKLLGIIAIMYLWWYNIMLIIKLYKFIKGSDT